jgi:biopolymer transport protein ExbD
VQRRRKAPQDEVGFNITPMIDMTFLLLIFFMVTTKITNEQVKKDIALPTAISAKQAEDLSNRDVINLDDTGALWVANRQVSDEEMKTYLASRFKVNPPLKLYLRADKNTPAKRIREFMKMASEAGAINVIFGSYQR